MYQDYPERESQLNSSLEAPRVRVHTIDIAVRALELALQNEPRLPANVIPVVFGQERPVAETYQPFDINNAPENRND